MVGPPGDFGVAVSTANLEGAFPTEGAFAATDGLGIFQLPDKLVGGLSALGFPGSTKPGSGGDSVVGFVDGTSSSRPCCTTCWVVEGIVPSASCIELSMRSLATFCAIVSVREVR